MAATVILPLSGNFFTVISVFCQYLNHCIC